MSDSLFDLFLLVDKASQFSQIQQKFTIQFGVVVFGTRMLIRISPIDHHRLGAFEQIVKVQILQATFGGLKPKARDKDNGRVFSVSVKIQLLIENGDSMTDDYELTWPSLLAIENVDVYYSSHCPAFLPPIWRCVWCCRIGVGTISTEHPYDRPPRPDLCDDATTISCLASHGPPYRPDYNTCQIEITEFILRINKCVLLVLFDQQLLALGIQLEWRLFRQLCRCIQ